MTKTVKTPATSIPAGIPADVQTQVAEARNNLFSVYPEIQKMYESFGSPETTLATKWFDKEVSERIGKFVVLIRKLELDELFPNFSALEKVSSLTDGGTINEKLLKALEDLCKKAFQINGKPEDEIFQTKGYRGIAIYLRNANLWDELGSESSIITKGIKLFGLDVKAIKDCVEVERLLNELGIEE